METYGVPNLEFDDFVVNFEDIRAKFDSNSHHVLLLELVVHNAFHKGRFAYARVANNN